MRQILIFLLFFSSQTVLSQYRVDSTVNKNFLKTLHTFPEELRDEIIKQNPAGLALIYEVKVDTLNKKDLKYQHISIKESTIDKVTGDIDSTNSFSPEKEEVSKNQPEPFSCNCLIRNDTLIITSGTFLFPGYSIIAKFYNNKVAAAFSEINSEGKFLQRKLKEEKKDELIVPAKVNFFSFDKIPTNNTKELFGQIAITTSGYYDYMNGWGFRHGYIHKQIKIKFYFKCKMKGNVQQ
jgi:hypothetical protein